MAKDRCVDCGSETEFESTMPIQFRVGYIEGNGQRCRLCFRKILLKIRLEDTQKAIKVIEEEIIQRDKACPLCKRFISDIDIEYYLSDGRTHLDCALKLEENRESRKVSQE